MILIINPNHRIQSPLAGQEQPLWAGLIASDLMANGQSVNVIDAEAMNMSADDVARDVRSSTSIDRIIIVAMGNNPSASSTPKMVAVKALVERLRGVAPIEVTGLHPLALPEQTAQDLGVKVMPVKPFYGTPDMPWKLFPMDLYRAHNWQCIDGSKRQPYAVTYTSMGCPYSCEFCNIHTLYGGRQVHYREPKAVADEIAVLVNQYGVRTFKLWDELFGLNRDHVLAVCKEIRDRGFPSLNIWAYVRADGVSLDMLRSMRQAHIWWVGIGFESGDDTILKGVDKGRASTTAGQLARHYCQEADINIIGNFIFGLPGDDAHTMQKTLDYAKQLCPEWANFYRCYTYPGSELWNKQAQKSTDWEAYSQFSGGVLQDEAMAFRDKAFNEFFGDRNYRFHMRRKFGEQAIDQIDYMLSMGKPTDRKE